MSPNTERYNFTFKWNNLCENRKPTINPDTVYGILKSNQVFTKTVKLIEDGMLAEYLSKNYDGFTLFVTSDANIPDSFMKSTDLFTSKKFINSYLLNGIATPEYLLKNSSSIYKTVSGDNPLLIYIPENTRDIYVNKIGKILYNLNALNGVIYVMDNITQVQY